MGVVSELIRTESDGTISFGDYTLSTKAKIDNYEYKGDIYKVKTCEEITKLECNGAFVYESVPGTTAHNLRVAAEEVSFTVEGIGDAQVTLELETEAEYEVIVGGNLAGRMKTNLGGKISISVELGDRPVEVSVHKC